MYFYMCSYTYIHTHISLRIYILIYVHKSYRTSDVKDQLRLMLRTVSCNRGSFRAPGLTAYVLRVCWASQLLTVDADQLRGVHASWAEVETVASWLESGCPVITCFPQELLSVMMRLAVCGGLLAAVVVLKGCGDEVTYAACSSYSKNGAGAVTDYASCATACDKGEGLQETYGNHDWKGSSGSGKCDCKVSDSQHRTACQDTEYSS